MKYAEKQQAWAWRQVRLVRAVADAALAADPTTIKPATVLDQISDIAVLNGREAEMERWLKTLEDQHQLIATGKGVA